MHAIRRPVTRLSPRVRLTQELEGLQAGTVLFDLGLDEHGRRIVSRDESGRGRFSIPNECVEEMP
jgi:hypothetical protein